MRVRIVRRRAGGTVRVSSGAMPVSTTHDQASTPPPASETQTASGAVRHSDIVLDIRVTPLRGTDALATRESFERALDAERRKFAAASQYLLDLLDPGIRTQAKEYVESMLLNWDDLEAEKQSLEGRMRKLAPVSAEVLAGQLFGLHRLLGLR